MSDYLAKTLEREIPVQQHATFYQTNLKCLSPEFLSTPEVLAQNHNKSEVNLFKAFQSLNIPVDF